MTPSSSTPLRNTPLLQKEEKTTCLLVRKWYRFFISGLFLVVLGQIVPITPQRREKIALSIKEVAATYFSE